MGAEIIQRPLFGPENVYRLRDAFGHYWVVHQLNGRELKYGPFAMEAYAIEVYNKVASNPQKLWNQEELKHGKRGRKREHR